MIAPVALLGSGATPFITTTAANNSIQNEQIDYQAPSQGNTIDQLSQYLEPVVFDTTNNKDECPICLDVLHQTSGAATSTVVRMKKCRHCFHKDCIVKMFQSQHNRCPTCRELIDGDGLGQGPSGRMTITFISGKNCPGFEYDCNGVIEIYYSMPSGIQTSYMENPGQNYFGTSRKAYLPHNESGRKLLARLKFAFTHGLVFRIGTSLTTGTANEITWASIHHKTSLNAGAHGYPDDQYLTNCNDALDALHVPK
ncbi:hypothetical protein FRACYDRAFT_269181 [Fragilariopsis cylindrus CCMP1102]|uniref:RING-type E3 ubiquitin transferase n=1 Tax=Fragilariopsis cylindrus CCMP1102 TaxID=635003 RepID=A0A1E7FAY2_9STRA|nr:hypothetical protein FRACYDRAFT_269181 [Fragilariopsis cylindrus CCMP1102]|eukprot:OEU14993.1 hypothetical protein FRACYDRAFT_269181 [Fragilariopsis cylindrus CCMP1102]